MADSSSDGVPKGGNLAETATVAGASGDGQGVSAIVTRLSPGARIGAYTITRQLGQGAMGAVFEGVHEALGRRAAIKVLLGQGAAGTELLDRFVREGQAASRIRHPNIVEVHDVGVIDGTPFLVMELLEGEDLASLLSRKGSLPVELAAELMVPVLCGLAAAHDAGIVHRDLKPGNIFLARGSGESITPKIVDFGISKMVDPDRAGSLTATSALLGTPYYMSPEQVESSKHVDARSDQYSAGVILYEALAGERPFRQESMLALLTSIHRGEHEPLSKVAPSVQPEVLAAVERAMQTSPNARFESVRDLARALLPFAGERVRVLHAAELANRDHEAALPTLPSREAPSLSGSARTAGGSVNAHLHPAGRMLFNGGIALAVIAAAIAIWRVTDKSQNLSDRVSLPASPSAAASQPMPSAASPRTSPASNAYYPCEQQDAGGRGRCSDNAQAWCDRSRNRVACCAPGLVASDPEGSCTCPPGGLASAGDSGVQCPVSNFTGDAYSKSIQTTVRSHYTHLRACYELSLRTSAAMDAAMPSGKISVYSEVGPEGEVYQARLVNVTVPDPKFQSCVLDAYREMRFQPPPGGSVTFVYPILFTPDD